MDGRPIGVFDSGLGGLTVVRALLDLLPDEHLVYFGDTGRFPYGPKPREDVLKYAFEITELLMGHDVKLVVVGCNSAAAAALTELRARYEVPLTGVIEPGLRAAARATRTGRIGVIGTVGTIASGAYQRAAAALWPVIELSCAACPGFVEFVEAGDVDSDQVFVLAERLLAPVRAAEVDTLVLGCTHYPLLRGVLGHAARTLAGHDVAVVDSATAMAEAAREALGSGLDGAGTANRRGEPGRLDCFATDTSRLDELAPRFLGEPLTGFELVDL
jgi:glutamate racemase